mgnify:CR=1 FL=1
METKIQNEGPKLQETLYPSMKSNLKWINNLKGKLEVLKKGILFQTRKFQLCATILEQSHLEFRKTKNWKLYTVGN